MGDRTGIEWTDATWNPVLGCSVVSPGCTNCYAMKVAARLEAISVAHEAAHGGDPGPTVRYRGLTTETRGGPVWTGEVRLDKTMLDRPLRWKRPRRIFVNSMSDLFHEALVEDEIAEVFGVMAVAGRPFHGPSDGHRPIGKPMPLYRGGEPVQMKLPNAKHGPHVFQVLTKRAERMRRLLTDYTFRRKVAAAAYRHANDRVNAGGLAEGIERGDDWPLPNVWLGFSAEDQQRFDDRWPHMEPLARAGWLTWCSAEPLLGPINAKPAIGWRCAVGGQVTTEMACHDCDPCLGALGRGFLRWMVAGGESGPNARRFNAAWALSIIEQCRAAAVPCFVKQMGSNPDLHGDRMDLRDRKGGDWSEWPEGLRVREFPNA
ncbi:MAG TPA: DUF5131 family protein [Longimicrobiales bacterium]